MASSPPSSANAAGQNSTPPSSSPRHPPESRGIRCLCEAIGPPDDGRLPWDYSVLCSACSRNGLRSSIERHEQALLERDLTRERCAQRLAVVNSRSGTNFFELQFESQRLRDRRAQLQQECAALAVEVAALAVENEEQRESIQYPQATIQRQHLQRLDQSICEGSLKQAIDAGREQIKILRFQWALKAFAMHRLVVRPEDMISTNDTEDRRRRSQMDGTKKARGIGKIGGLPLPHAGPELYGVLPPQELQSALRLVASISSTVARCLGIILPHPVLLQVASSSQQQGGDDIIHSAVLTKRTTATTQTQGHPSVGEDHDTTSEAALLAILDTSLEDTNSAAANGSRNISTETGKRQSTTTEERNKTSAAQPSMDSTLVAQRLRHATAAVLAEASTPCSKSSQYTLAADNMNQDEFAIALQFLQNNVMSLCIRAGVTVEKLWPAEAVLLNLYALQMFCEDQVKQILKQ
ncbi:expressed unknown protein [Seminavis robusta]|uniref:Uncharacterized protein n=1 Tax=Seminavis robusta TaxID=568900 RepID=A0A9N8HDC9_9STRA|nr:expressed unknown protein [Seminavis robusta]|eukprot:Sro355_g124990.1 n/a (466) ;mRNA; f:17367-18764